MAGGEHIVAADIGGTHARFAKAALHADGSIILDEPLVLKTSDFAGLSDAWQAYLAQTDDPAPAGASLAVAGPVGSGAFKLTNNNWTFEPANLAAQLGTPRVTLLNDFAAVAHAAASDPSRAHLSHLAGPDDWCEPHERVTVIGPGTGLGIAHYCLIEGKPLIQATEGAHIDFAPVDAVDDALLARLRGKFARVSLERVVSGAGIADIYAVLAEQLGEEPLLTEALDIWQMGQSGADPLAAQAIAHFIKTLGRAAGDYALAHGSSAIVIAGGLGQRLQEQLTAPEFHAALLDKGRYRSMMEAIPITLITHAQPGLLGAAAAFANEYSL